MAGTKLSAEEQAFFDSPPDATPLEDTPADRTPNTEQDGETPEAPVESKPEAKPADAKAKAGDKGKDEGKKGEPEKQRTVSHAALERERQERKAAQEALRRKEAEWGERQARLDERLAIINEALQPKQAPQQPPSPDQDIFGAFDHLSGEFNALKQERAQERQRQQQAQAQAERTNQMMAVYRQDAARLVAEEPAFKDAYNFLLASRQAELTALGFDVATIARTVASDELSIVDSALRRGMSPAETIFAAARARGFKVPEPQAADEEARPKGADEQPAANGADKIDRLAQTREASVSLSTAGGSPGGEKITLEAIDRMKPDEFKAFVAKINKNNPKGYDRLMQKLMLGG